ncbi:hypothetical protein ACFVY4_33285 [Streptomyces sp. NPDC058299]|uniref:hypothetical protein n=1 Tax=Streptomyces sp. NPDC058299 TaxID=3346435 RepID=UPI0036E6CC38
MAAIAVVLDHTTATALYDPEDPFNEDVQGSGGPGDPYASALSLTAGDAERPGLLSYIKGLRFIRIEAFDTDAAITATELLRFGHPWAALQPSTPPPPLPRSPHRPVPAHPDVGGVRPHRRPGRPPRPVTAGVPSG